MQTITLDTIDNLLIFSDLHCFHRNVLDFCKRPFENEKQMNAGLINNFNSKSNPDTIAFSLGDMFWFDSSRECKKILHSMIFKTLYYIPGNHCSEKLLQNIHDWDERIIVCDSIVHLNFLDSKVYYVLSHYPLLTWPNRASWHIDDDKRKSYNLFGHIHSRLDWDGKDRDCPYSFDQIDVGVDSHNLFPYTFEEVNEHLKLQERFKIFITPCE